MDINNPKFVFTTMDLDTHPAYVDNRKTRYAKNIIKYNQGKGRNGVPKSVLGNEACFNITAPIQKNIQFKIWSTAPASPMIYYGTMYNRFFVPYWTATVGVPTDLADFILDFNTQLLAAGFTDQCILQPDGSYILEVTLIPGDVYIIPTTGKDSDPLRIDIIQQPIDPSLTEATPVITGSYDMNGATYIISSLDNDQRSIFDIVSLSASGAEIEVTLSKNHNITTPYEWVEINSDTNIYPYGKWSAVSTGATTFLLKGSDSALLPIVLTNGTATTKVSTWFELGMNDQTCGDNCGYTRLLGTTEIPASVYHQQDVVAEPQSSCKDAVYFTDNNDNPRCIYVPIPYVEDGCIVTNGGEYDFGNIASKTLLWTSNSAKVTLKQQLSKGGSLKGAAWEYCATFLIDEATETEPTLLTNQVYVGNTNPLKPQATSGVSNLNDEETTNANEMLISDIPSGVYKYVVLYGVRFYNGSIIEAVRIRQQLLANETSIVIQHTGNELNATPTDAALLQFVGNVYEKARNIDIVKNKLVLSNLTRITIPDLTEWANKFTHSIIYKEIPMWSAGSVYTGAENPNQYMGYMANEVYRYGLIARNRKTQTYFPVAYWVDDIIIDTNLVTNSANPTDNRRVVATLGTPFADYSLTDSATKTIRIPHVEFSNINWDYVIDGVQVRDLIDEIQIVRVECVPEILATGLAVACSALTGIVPYFSSTPVGYSHPYPGLCGSSGAQLQDTTDALTNVINKVAFYSPDIYVVNSRLNITDGVDTLLNLGFPIPIAGTHATVKDTMADFSSFVEIAPDAMLTNVVTHVIDTKGYCGTGDYITVGADSYTNHVVRLAGTDDKKTFECYFFKSSTNIMSIGNKTYVLAQVKKALTDKYGDKLFSRYINTNTYVPVDTTAVEVFGGDTYTYGSYLHIRASISPEADGHNGGVMYYTQARNNATLRAIEKDSAGVANKYYKVNSELPQWLEDYPNEHFSYNTGYTEFGRAHINIYPAYNPTLSDCNTDIALFHWSSQKIQGSGNDAYRVFKPLNIKMGNLRYGEIVHHGTYNGELVSWQKRGFVRYYFDANNILRTTDISEILLGSDTTMRGNGQLITSLGSQHKWSVIKGISPGGNDTYYWWNLELGCINRIGQDGTVRKSKIDGIETELEAIKNYLECWDTPAAGAGICGVFDKGRNLAIWTARGLAPEVTKYLNTTNYVIGDVVYYNGGVYKSLTANINELPKGNAQWQFIPETNTTYYNVFTLVYDENDNGFMCFNSAKPKIYIQAKSNYYSPRYNTTVDTNLGCQVYRHNAGNYMSWYDGQIVEDGYIEVVLNAGQSLLKHYMSVYAESNIRPYKIDVETDTQKTTMLTSEFEQQITQWRASVKNDSTTSFDPKGDTSAIISTFAIVRFWFKAGDYCELLSISANINSVDLNK